MLKRECDGKNVIFLLSLLLPQTLLLPLSLSPLLLFVL